MLLFFSACDSDESGDGKSNVASFQEAVSAQSDDKSQGKLQPLQGSTVTLKFRRQLLEKANILADLDVSLSLADKFLVAQVNFQPGNTLYGVNKDEMLAIWLCDSKGENARSYRYNLFPSILRDDYEMLAQSIGPEGFSPLTTKGILGASIPEVSGTSYSFSLVMALPDSLKEKGKLAISYWEPSQQGGNVVLATDPPTLNSVKIDTEQFRDFTLKQLPKSDLTEAQVKGMIEKSEARAAILDLLRSERSVAQEARSAAQKIENPGERRKRLDEIFEQELSAYRAAAGQLPDNAFVQTVEIQDKVEKGSATGEEIESLVMRLPLVTRDVFQILDSRIRYPKHRQSALDLYANVLLAIGEMNGVSRDLPAYRANVLVDSILAGTDDALLAETFISRTKPLFENVDSKILGNRNLFEVLSKILNSKDPELLAAYLKGEQVMPYLDAALKKIVLMSSNLGGVLSIEQLQNVFDTLQKLEKPNEALDLGTKTLMNVLGLKKADAFDQLFEVVDKLRANASPELTLNWDALSLAGVAAVHPDKASSALELAKKRVLSNETYSREFAVMSFGGALSGCINLFYEAHDRRNKDKLVDVLFNAFEKDPTDALILLRILPDLCEFELKQGNVAPFSAHLSRIESVFESVSKSNHAKKESALSSTIRDTQPRLAKLRTYALLLDPSTSPEMLSERYPKEIDLNRLVADLTNSTSGVLKELFHRGYPDLGKQVIECACAFFAARKSPKSNLALLALSASWCIDIGETEGAQALNDQAKEAAKSMAAAELKGDPKYPLVLYNTTRNFARQQRFDDAIEYIETLQEQEIPHPKSEEFLDLYKALKKKLEEERELIEKEPDDLPRIELVLDSGTIELVLYEDDAPNHTANIISLIEEGVLNGTTFHRVEHAFVVQGGDPATAGRPAPNFGIPLEVGRKHLRGSLGMARAQDPNSASTQFYIVTEDGGGSQNLDSYPSDAGYTVFGRVVKGLDVVDKITVGTVIVDTRVISKRDHKYQPNREYLR